MFVISNSLQIDRYSRLIQRFVMKRKNPPSVLSFSTKISHQVARDDELSAAPRSHSRSNDNDNIVQNIIYQYDAKGIEVRTNACIHHHLRMSRNRL